MQEAKLMLDAQRFVSRWWIVPLRLFVGAMWHYHGLQKVDPTFGGIRGIIRVMAGGNDVHPEGNPIEPFRRFLLDVVLPHWQVFGAMITAAEILVGLALIFGMLTRLGSLGGIFLQAQYWMGRGYLEWPFVYPAIIVTHIVLIWTAAGRTFGIDAWLARRRPRTWLW